MTRETADVVVVGGGIVGITIAFHLARAGAGRIVLGERRTIGSGTSSMSGAVRGQQAEVDDTICRLAHRAREISQRFGDVVGGDCIRVLRDTRNPLVRIEPDPTDAVCPQWMVEHASDVIHCRLPKLRHGRFQGACQTCYDDTPDLMPLLGDAPGYENLFLDCGWSGRGFKFSVALGEYLVPWILEGKNDLDLAPWLATRFGAPTGT